MIPKSHAPGGTRAFVIRETVLTFALLFSIGNDLNATEDLVFGMSTALTGPAGQLGTNVRAGFDAAFAEQNRLGGIRGRELQLKVLDDGYEPARTGPNINQLVKEDRVLAIVGNVGTPTAVVAIPICNREKTLFFGAYTGAGVLRRDPPDRYVINYRASYAEETAAIVEALINEAGLHPNEIAFFTQRDAYGDAGYVGGLEALKRHGLIDERSIAHGRYERNTTVVENGLADILTAETPVKAVVMVGTYEPCAMFIRLAKEMELDAMFLNVSFVGAEPLANELGSDSEDVVVTQVVPHLNDNLPIVREFNSALDASNTNVEPTFAALEGYVSGRILIEALRGIEGPITRDSIVDALEALGSFDIGIGRQLHLGPNKHQASHTIWPSVIRGGNIEPLQWSSLRTN